MQIFRHPKAVCMTYFEHAKLSLYFSYLFSKGAVLAVVHAIIPDIATTSTSDTVDAVSHILANAGCRDKDKDE